MTDEYCEVHFKDFPVAVQAKAAAHLDALQREFSLIRARAESQESVPHRLLALIEDLTNAYGGIGDRPNIEIAAARERGDESIDLVYRVPASVADASRRLAALLDDADRYCRQGGQLLTLATPPDALAFRRWFLSEFASQLAGGQPRAWPDFKWETSAPTAPSPATTHAPARVLPAGWTVERSDGHAAVTIDQELEMQTAPVLREVLQDLCDGTVHQVTLDLTRVEFLDSVGLSVLIAGYRRLTGADAQVQLLTSGPVRHTLEIAGLLEFLGVDRPAAAG